MKKIGLTHPPVVWSKLQKMEQKNVSLFSIKHFRDRIVHYFNYQCKLKPHGPLFFSKMAITNGKTRKKLIHLR